jgi:hypothetical protein
MNRKEESSRLTQKRIAWSHSLNYALNLIHYKQLPYFDLLDEDTEL